jgi:PAS domain S-box-containing protein
MASPQQGAPHNQTEQLRLLIVDDDVDFAESLLEVLESRGYQVALAHTAADTLKIIRDFDAQIALIDIRLDRDNGIRLIPALREARPGILCLTITAYAGIENAVEALKHGAYDYLRKPLDPQDLFATLDRCFERLRLEREKNQAEENLRISNQELEELNARLKKLLVSSRVLATCSHPSELSQSLLQEFARNVNAQGGSFFVLKDDDLVLMHSLDPSHVPGNLSFPLRESSVFDLAIKNRAPVLIEKIGQEKDVATSGWQGYQDDSLLAFPLVDGSGEIVGVVSLHNKVSPPFTQQDCELGSLLASYGSETLRVTRIFEALRASEEKYRNILQSIDEGYFELYLSGRVSFLNDSMVRILGCSEEELKRLGEEAKPGDDVLAQVQGMFEQICRSALSPKMMDYQIVRKDGSPCFLELSTSPIEDSAGQLKGYRGVVRDVTARRLAEQERQRLAAALENTADSVIIANRDGLIQYVNPAFERIIGLRRDDVSGQRLDQFLISKSDPESSSLVRKALALGQSWNGHLVVSRSDKTMCEFETTISPIHDGSGEIAGFVCINRDVTNEINLEGQLRQAQKMEAVGTLAGGVAHDFNNILQAVIGYSELLLRGKNKETAEYGSLTNIKKSAMRGADLTKQLLTFSRKVEVQKRAYALNEGILEARSLLERVIPRMIAIELDLMQELNLVNADPGQVQQIMLNLAVNARDAMPDGGRITIKTENIFLDTDYCKTHLLMRPGSYVQLTVSDTGHGIDAESLEHIFEPFYTTKAPGSGTGLGLSTAYGIVKSHDGHIECESAVGLGTTFRILLPAVDSIPMPDGPQIQDEALSGGGETILIADDEESVRSIISQMLTTFGYRVLLAETGLQALAIYRNNREAIDLVILDLIMPEMGGKQCLEEILVIDPKAKVLIATGYTNKTTSEDIVTAGAANIIMKPFSMNEILRAINEALGRG